MARLSRALWLKVSIPFFCLAVLIANGSSRGSGPSNQALSGTVTSVQEGRMEGVLVSAKSEQRPITVTVVTDADGRYSFARDHLQPGRYKLSIRATGYELAQPVHVAIGQNGTATTDLRLRPVADFSRQLTSAEWLVSMPGREENKSTLYRCVACHDLTPIVQSRYDEKSWPGTIERMQTFVPASVLTAPVENPEPPPPGRPDPQFVKFLASINLDGRTTWPFHLRKFPRPKGAETRVVITEYDLPGPSLPHDAAVGHDGFIYYDDFQRPLVGRLDPHTGQAKEWALPILRPGFPEGLLSIKIDNNGDLWIPRFFQGCTLIRMNTKTEQMTTWTVPAKYNGPESRCGHVALGAPDGTVWMSDSGGRRMFRLHPDSGAFETFNSFPGNSLPEGAVSIETAGRKSTGHRTYGIGVDSKGNGYFADIAGGTIGEIDAHTGHVTLHPTPTPDSGPRRTFMDNEDHYWFGENYASKVGMYDTNTKQMREWVPPVPWNGAYPVVRDGNGDVWTVGMSTDYVYRLNPTTGAFTFYLLPTLRANLRRVDIDNSVSPLAVWTAEVHRGKLAKIEPLP